MNISSMFTSKISSIPNYQQQSGQKNFDIHFKTFLHPTSVQHTQSSMFANNPFQRTFASVVSCKTPILQKPNDNASKRGFVKPNNDGILNCLLKKFTMQKRTATSTMLPPKVPYFESSHVHKEFEDFTTLPTTYLQHNNQRTASAKTNSQSMQNANNKNRHEKHRHSIEHDIRVDCDIFNIKKVNNNSNNSNIQTTIRNTKQTNAMKSETENLPNSGSSLNPPFEIQSLKEFPAISPPSTTSHDQTVNACMATTTKTSTDESDENDYVKFHDDIAKTTPTFIPRRYNLCEKVTSIVKSPKKLLSIPMMSPRRSCLKPTMRRTRTVSECSDDFIVFDRSCCDGSNTNIDDIESENEMEMEDDEESDMSDDEDDCGIEDNDESDEDLDDDCLDGNNNQHLLDIMGMDSHQPDSGVEEKKVHFNLVPKVHTIVAWNYAYRQARRGDIWRQGAVDRERFAKRVAECSKSINPILDRDHRNRIFEDRFRQLEAQ